MLPGQTAHSLTAVATATGIQDRWRGSIISLSNCVCICVGGGEEGRAGEAGRELKDPQRRQQAAIYVPAHLPSFLGKPQHISGPLAPETLERCL